MFSRLLRYFSRSTRGNNKDNPLSIAPPQQPFPTDFSERPSTASSGHSSSSSIGPESASSFLQIVSSDFHPVCYEETDRLYLPSALDPRTRKVNPFHDMAREEIFRERMRVTELGNEWGQHGLTRKKLISSARRERKWERHYEKVRQWNYGSHEEHVQRRENRYHASDEEQARNAEEYTSMDHFYCPPIHRDPSNVISIQRYTPNISSPSIGERGYLQYSSRPPIHGLFGSPQHQQPYPVERFARPLSEHGKYVPARPYLARTSSVRQVPYHFDQTLQTPASPYHHPDFYSKLGRAGVQRSKFDDISEIPVTRVTRLKPSYKIFGTDHDVKSDVGIGFGRISEMASARRVSGRRATKSDVGVGTSLSYRVQQPFQVQALLSQALTEVGSPVTNPESVKQ